MRFGIDDWKREAFAPLDWGVVAQCPVCGTEYNHYGTPHRMDGDDYTAWYGRGPALRIPFKCEHGHKWNLRIGFHKGYSFLEVEAGRQDADAR